MIRPPRGSWSFMSRNAAWVQRNAPVRLTSTTRRHCSTVRSSSGTAGAPRAGVVEQQVEAAEGLPRRLEEGRDRRGIAHVGRERPAPACRPVPPRPTVCSRASRRRPASTTEYPSSRGRGRSPGRFRTRAGDHRDLAVGSHRLVPPSSLNSSAPIHSIGEPRLHLPRSRLQCFVPGADRISVFPRGTNRIAL